MKLSKFKDIFDKADRLLRKFSNADNEIRNIAHKAYNVITYPDLFLKHLWNFLKSKECYTDFHPEVKSS